MTQQTPARESSLPSVAFFALFLLIFLQLLSDLIETTYVFGLLGVSIPPEVVSVLFLLAPLLLIFFPRAMESRTFAAVSAVIALLCRAAAVLLDTRWKMLLSGLGVGLMLLFFAALLWQMRGRKLVLRLGLALAFASIGLILLRAMSYGTDHTTFADNYRTVFGLVLLAGVSLLEWQRSARKAPLPGPEVEPATLGSGRAIALGIGLFSAPLLLYFGLSSPAVLARWTEGSYTGVTLLLSGSVAVWAGLWARSARFRAWAVRQRVLEIWNGLFLIALAMLLRAYTVNFPADPAAYPLPAPAPGPLSWLALLLVLALHPVIFVDFALLAQALLDRVNRPRQVAVAVFAGSLWLLLMAFAHVFTTVYDYIPIIGPLFRDRFWLVYTAAGLGMILPLLLARTADTGEEDTEPKRRTPWVVSAVALFVLANLIAFLQEGKPVPPQTGAPSLRVLTYNIQQGYTEGGQKGLDAQLEVIRRLEPDIIGLQESDTARVAGGNADVVRYFADQLDYYSYYGPSTVTGTFGIALLSRYPIEDPQTFFMYSEGEQTAAILATVRSGDTPYTVLVTHLGNDGPIIQQENVLKILEARDNVIAMGDFNFRPGSEQYSFTTAQYEDAWEVAGAQEVESPELDPGRKIDHVFVSRGLTVQRAVYINRGPSDHPALFVEIGR